MDIADISPKNINTPLRPLERGAMLSVRQICPLRALCPVITVGNGVGLYTPTRNSKAAVDAVNGLFFNRVNQLVF